MRWLRENWPPAVVLFGVVVLVAAMIAVAIRDNQAWERFKLQHNCKVVSEESARVVTGTINGKPSTHVEAGKTTGCATTA